MILVKISAEDERCAQAAKTVQELEGLREMLLERIEQAKVLKDFRKAKDMKIQRLKSSYSATYTWKDALVTAREVLGSSGVQVPPYPTQSWYASLNAHMRSYGLGEPEVRALAEYVRDNMRTPIKLDFMLRQRERILAGEWAAANNRPAPEAPRINIYANKLPDD